MRLLRLLAALALLTASLSMATPVGAGSGCHPGSDLPERTEGAEPEVKMTPCAFAPTVVRVAPGTTVTWFNDQVPHLLTGANQEWGSRDDEIGAGKAVSYRFDRPGTYPYACAIHLGMSGTIVVGDGIAFSAAAAAAGAAPAVVAVKGTSAAPARSAAPAAAAPAGSAQPAAAAVAVATEPATAISNVQVAALLAIGGVVVLVLALALAWLVAARSRGRAIGA